MTREEQIKQAAEKSSEHISDWVWNFAYRSHFIAGAEWADEHPVIKVGGASKNYERGYQEAVQKACEYLKTVIEVTDDCINDFKKTMEQ